MIAFSLTANWGAAADAGQITSPGSRNQQAHDQSSRPISSTPTSLSGESDQALSYLLLENMELLDDNALSRSFNGPMPSENQTELPVTQPASGTAVPTSALTAQPTTPPTGTSPTAATTTPTTPPPTTQTAAPTPTPTSTPTKTATTTAGVAFPVRNYGTLFHDRYNTSVGSIANEDGTVVINTGNTAKGVVLVNIHVAPDGRYWKAILKGPTGSFSYDLLKRNTEIGLPLQMGNGSFTLTIYEGVSSTSFSNRMAHTFNVTLNSSLSPFTASSVMVDFASNSTCTTLAASLVAGKTTQVARIDAIYQWIVANIAYDRTLSASISSGTVKSYIPNPDATLRARKGICFDYAALMAAMLRSQGIPTRLIIGQIAQGYHAWNEVYIDGTGWIEIGGTNYKQIDGGTWVLFDPTLAASGISTQTILTMTHNKERTY